MKFSKAKKLSEIASIIGCKYIGAADFPVLGFNEIHRVEHGDIVFVDHPKYYDKALGSAASIVIINKEVECPQGKALLISDDPFRDFNKLTTTYAPFVPATAMVAESAEIGEGTIVQPGVFIGNNVKIGADCLIHPNVTIYDGTVIGNKVTIHAGSVLGADAFYYKKRADRFDKLLSSGNVVIQDDVEIGACCTIDRGVSCSTMIKRGTKLDNHVQIGHDTVIGEMCLFASQVGVAGCDDIGERVTLWGQVGVTSGISIEAETVVLACSGVSKTLKKGTYFGAPAEDAKKYYKQSAFLRILPELLKNKL